MSQLVRYRNPVPSGRTLVRAPVSFGELEPQPFFGFFITATSTGTSSTSGALRVAVALEGTSAAVSETGPLYPSDTLLVSDTLITGVSTRMTVAFTLAATSAATSATSGSLETGIPTISLSPTSLTFAGAL